VVLDFFQHQVPTKIVGGSPGLLAQVGPELETWRGSRACVVMDSVIQQLNVLDNLRPSLEDAGIEVVATFCDVPQDSDVTVVQRAASRFAEAGCQLLIAIGGGSVIDTAKAVNIVLTHGGDIRDYQGVQALSQPLLPLVAVPTTVGTGSEVTMVSVIVDRDEQRKLTLVDHALAPTIALLDPAVTFTLPPRLVASTAMDALTHALEAYIDLAHSPFSDAWAVAAAQMIRENLVQALEPEGFEEARANLQMAATMAGIAFNHSMVGVVHAMSHALGGVCGVPHGTANALMLIEGLRCNGEVVADRIAEIGVRAGFVSTRGRDHQEAASQVIDAIAVFRDEVMRKAGLPKNLREAGVQEQHLPLLVERALEDGSLAYNPKPVEASEIEQMYRNVMGE
jgi:alcohol dehydrogenase class IV